MNDKIKKCPFCGHSFEIVYSDEFDGYLVVHEFDCPMQSSESETGFVYSSEEEATQALNTRPLEDALQARIDELEHKNRVLMDSYLESETINDKGELVGSLEHFRQRIAELQARIAKMDAYIIQVLRLLNNIECDYNGQVPYDELKPSLATIYKLLKEADNVSKIQRSND